MSDNRVFAFSHAKGGCGSTTAVLLLAHYLGDRCTVVDFDPTQNITLAIQENRWDPRKDSDIGFHAEYFNDLLVPGRHGGRLLAAGKGAVYNSKEDLSFLYEALRDLPGIVLVDLPGKGGKTMLEMAAASDITVTPVMLGHTDLVVQGPWIRGVLKYRGSERVRVLISAYKKAASALNAQGLGLLDAFDPPYLRTKIPDRVTYKQIAVTGVKDNEMREVAKALAEELNIG